MNNTFLSSYFRKNEGHLVYGDMTIKSIIMKYIFVCIFLFICYQGKTQTIDEYQKFLTSDSSQSWRADSSAVTGFLTEIDEFKRGAVLTFRLADKSVKMQSPHKAMDARKWQLVKEGSSILLKIDNIKPFEIDFIQKNSLVYMRLRGAERPDKNVYICEYYFTRSTW